MTLWLYPWQMAKVPNKKLEFHCKKQLGWKSRTHTDTAGIQKALIMFSWRFFPISAPQLCQCSCQRGMHRILLLIQPFPGFQQLKKSSSQSLTLPDHLNFDIRCTIYIVFGEKVFGNVGLTWEPFPTASQLSKCGFIFSDQFVLVKSIILYFSLPASKHSLYLQSTDQLLYLLHLCFPC